jgi:DnaJ-class molecular chaperone
MLYIYSMPTTETCKTCKGVGTILALVSQHDDKKELVTCPHCGGKGKQHFMTREEEDDYRANNDW